MKLAVFNAVCDVEIGDEVKIVFSNTITEITDIRTVHYLKDQRVEFEFELANVPGLWFKREGFVYPALVQADQTRWDKAITHARGMVAIYKGIPTGIFGATMIGMDIEKFDRGDRSPELLEALEGIK